MTIVICPELSVVTVHKPTDVKYSFITPHDNIERSGYLANIIFFTPQTNIERSGQYTYHANIIFFTPYDNIERSGHS